MATTILTGKAKEGSTYIITTTFKDENGDTVVPVSASWSLFDSNYSVVNSRLDVAMIPATSVSVVLSGADLNYIPITKAKRFFVVKGIYNSSTYGNNLPINDECIFEIDPLIGIANA
jgi:hypothetical protein